MADENTNAEREQRAPETANAEFIKQWCGRVKKAKVHHGKAFDRMEKDMQFARGLQWPGQEDLNDTRYVANIVQRHLRQREAALYAKNPTAVARRRHTLDFRVWDGSPQSLAMAQQQLVAGQQALAQAVQAGNMVMAQQVQAQQQQAQELLQDYQEGTRRRQQIDRMAKTLEIVWQHQTGEQQPPFKSSMKHLVRRALTTGVGYLKLGYHRFKEFRPEDVARVTDLTEQLSAVQARLAEMSEDSSEYDETSAEAAELEHLIGKVSGDQSAFMREGLDFDFPKATSIIPDDACYQLDGFLGARWVAQEFLLTAEQVRQIYGVDIKDKYTHHTAGGEEVSSDAVADLYKDGATPDCRALVWEIYDKYAGQTFTVCLGHDEYLVAPKTPDVHLERFWPFFVLTFNGLEDEKHIFPPSDVRLMRQQQVELNLMRQRLREHRDASRPGHVAPKGRLDDEDKRRLSNREAHDVVELNGLADQDDIRRILQPIPSNPIDPNQYETGQIEGDLYKVLGSQEAVMGGLSNATATETSIAESSRLSSIGSAVDDLDDFLTQVAKFASHLLLTEMSAETVTEIAGPGAMWPQLSAEDVAKDLWLEIRAGSSGRPNKSAEIQNLERVMPFLLQIPGVPPERILREILERLDDRLEVEDFYTAGLPSIMSMNRQSQMGTGDPASDPNEQGGEGGDKNAVQQGDSNMGPREPAQARNMDPNVAR